MRIQCCHRGCRVARCQLKRRLWALSHPQHVCQRCAESISGAECAALIRRPAPFECRLVEDSGITSQPGSMFPVRDTDETLASPTEAPADIHYGQAGTRQIHLLRKLSCLVLVEHEKITFCDDGLTLCKVCDDLAHAGVERHEFECAGRIRKALCDCPVGGLRRRGHIKQIGRFDRDGIGAQPPAASSICLASCFCPGRGCTSASIATRTSSVTPPRQSTFSMSV